MIDKITPRPDAQVQKMLAEDGFEDNGTIITGRNTYTAAFVNAEETEYLVVDPGVLKPADFINAVLTRRLPNPFMPDAPQRIATDTSQKLSIRFGETIKAYQAKGLNMDDLALIPLVLAGYARYLKGVNDEGEAFTPSPDPLLAEPQEIVAALEVKEAELYAGPGAVRKTLHKYVSAR